MNEEEEAVKFDGLILFLPGTSLGGLGWLGAPKDPQDGRCGGSRKFWQLGSARGCVREESCRPHGVLSKVDQLCPFAIYDLSQGWCTELCGGGRACAAFHRSAVWASVWFFSGSHAAPSFPGSRVKGMAGETLWTTCLAPVPHC